MLNFQPEREPTFDPLILDPADYHRAIQIVGDLRRLMRPDLIIAPDGDPYLYRWEVVPKSEQGEVYFHIQVASDPDRPLHDHPWHNQSVILAGGYTELVQENPPWSGTVTRDRHKGDVIQRAATEAHRLILPPGVPYTMTLFTTGPVIRAWGFWVPTHKGRPEWVDAREVTVATDDGRSIWKEPIR